MKIAIIGLPGAGKSRLSIEIMKDMNLKCLDMDELGIENLSIAMSGANWVASGIGDEYFLLAQQADLLIYLDYPWWICTKRALLRCLTNPGKLRRNIISLLNLIFFRKIIILNIWFRRHSHALTLRNHRSNALYEIKEHLSLLEI